MGAYLSEPKTTKDSLDSDGVYVSCGASSMQGWRISQEDAHNCLLDFDKTASLFAVYDGHGGHEVAEYCSKYLPDFIKQTENYIKGDYEQALKDAFLAFDETLVTPEVIEVLKKIASGKASEKTNNPGESGSDDEETIDDLVQEACMPLDEVMAKYKVAAGPLLKVMKGEGSKPPSSPMLRARRSCKSSEGAEGPSTSTSSSSAGTSGSSSSDVPGDVLKGDSEVSSSSSSHTKLTGLCNGDAHTNGETEEKEADTKTENEVEVGSSDLKKDKVNSESDKSEKCSEKIDRTEPDSSGVRNGDSHNVSSSSENGNTAVEGSDGISSSSPLKKKRVPLLTDIYQSLLQDDSDSSEEDETFTAEAGSDDDSDDAKEDGEDQGDEDDEDDSSADDEDDDDDEEEEDPDFPGMDVKEEPGSDSGCTAVIALLVGNELFVANAGDSRCVVCRDGKAVEMSVDHKPEDESEKERIETAGGKVTSDGRVNGGLNLSRAMGDHAYKQVKLLPPSKQMITALPDVQRLTVDPEKDEFMVLACDGIWNSLTSQEVVDFVRIKLEQKTERLSQICEELFDHCLAPNTQGDGTGCDNMTCVIVRFKPTVAAEPVTNKRPAEDEADEPSSKKSKLEEETAAC